MSERYSLPRPEKIVRNSPENWMDLLAQYWPGGSKINLGENFTVTKDAGLGYRRFVKGNGDKLSFELLLTDEASNLLKEKGNVAVKREIKKDVQRVRLDPYGESSIDPNIKMKTDQDSPKPHSINAFGRQLEDMLERPLAIKGYDKSSAYRDDLIEQFRCMRGLERRWENAPEYLRNILHIAKVYAAMRFPGKNDVEYDEYLIMERVVDPATVRDEFLGTNKEFRNVYGFRIDEDPLLAKIVNMEISNADKFKISLGRPPHTFYEWSTLQEALQHTGLTLPDLAGRNVLYPSNLSQDQRRYTIIDQGGRVGPYGPVGIMKRGHLRRAE